jgi:SAM-dependent methyltransferase
MTTWALRGVGWIHGTLVSHRRADALVNALVPLLAGNARIVDIGCGDGRLARRLGERLGASWIVGADVLAGDARIARVRYDGLRLPFAGKTFDAALLVDVLHHAVDPAAILREAMRVSRGVVVIKDHLRRGHWSQSALAFMDWFGNRPHDVRLGYRYLSRGEWERLFDELRLGVMELHVGIDLYPAPFGVVFRPEWQFVAKLTTVDAVGGRRGC